MNKKGIKGFQPVRFNVVNPKAITMAQLYGEMHKTTHEWTEGVLSFVVREHANDTAPTKKWAIFDG